MLDRAKRGCIFYCVLRASPLTDSSPSPWHSDRSRRWFIKRTVSNDPPLSIYVRIRPPIVHVQPIRFYAPMRRDAQPTVVVTWNVRQRQATRLQEIGQLRNLNDLSQRSQPNGDESDGVLFFVCRDGFDRFPSTLVLAPFCIESFASYLSDCQ